MRIRAGVCDRRVNRNSADCLLLEGRSHAKLECMMPSYDPRVLAQALTVGGGGLPEELYLGSNA